MKTGMIGYGKMGRGIFSLLSSAGSNVTVYVRDPAQAVLHDQRLEKRLRRGVRSGMMTEADFGEQRSKLTFSSELRDLRDCDLIVETIVEDFKKKSDVLRRIETLISRDALITTNTSSLSIKALSAALVYPERFCGLHFFHPVQLTTVVEIIRFDKTSHKTVSAIEEICQGLLKKRPLVVEDLPGSCINVPLSFLVCEALCILEQGLASPSRIDAIADTIMRVGPCSSADIVGIPLVSAATESSMGAIPTSFALPELGRKLLRDGRDGKAANQGIYLYQEDRPVDDSLDYYRNPGQTHSLIGHNDDDALRERLTASLYYAVLLLAQLKLGSLEDLCAGITDVIGLKLDLLEKLKTLGSAGIKDLCERLSRELGPRFDCRPIEGILSALDELDASSA